MITFDLDKEKTITVDTDIEGIDTSLLEFFFRVTVNGIEYGFEGKYSEGTLNINIPALKNVVGTNIDSGNYSAKLEACSLLEDGSGYYNLLWEGQIKLKLSPSIKVNLDVDDEPKKPKTKITSINEIDVEKPKAPESDVAIDQQETVPAVEEILVETTKVESKPQNTPPKKRRLLWK